MKKLLGIVVLGLLLGGCALPMTPNDKGEKMGFVHVYCEKTGYLSCASVNASTTNTSMGTIGDRGLLTTFEERALSFAEAKKGAMERCLKWSSQKSKKINCYYMSGYDVNAPRKSLTKTKSSGSKIDPSVWDDIISGSQGVLSGKSTSEALGGTTSSSSSTNSPSCFKTSERVSGTNKICIYNCMGSDVAVNVRSTQLCPMSIKQ